MSEIFGAHVSGAREKSPFGGLPFTLAQGLGRNFAEPLLQQLGFGGGTTGQQAGRERRLAGATGPLADFIRQIQGLAPQVGPEASAVGQRVSAAGSQAFTTLQGQVAQALEAANTFKREAFDPALETPFYQEAFRRGVEPARSGAAARGLLESGPGQQAEDDLARQLTTGFAQQQLGMQSQVPGLLTGPAQIGLNAVPQLGQALSAPYTEPMQALGGLFQLLTGGQQQGQQLLAQTAPQFVPFSGKQGLGGVGKTG